MLLGLPDRWAIASKSACLKPDEEIPFQPIVFGVVSRIAHDCVSKAPFTMGSPHSIIFSRVMGDKVFRQAAEEHIAKEVYERIRQMADADAD
jgi:hypothetical protein